MRREAVIHTNWKSSLYLIVMVLIAIGSAQAVDIYTVSPWTDDASTGIDSAATYTHAVNISNAAGPTVVNGVTLVHQNNATATNWAFPVSSAAGDTSLNVTGASNGFGTYFHHNGDWIELSGLTVGQVYELTLFSAAWSDDLRTMDVSTGVGNFIFDQNQYGNNNGIKLTVLYEAQSTTFRLNIQRIDGPIHLYAFVNKVYSGDLPAGHAALISPVDGEDLYFSPAEDVLFDWTYARFLAGNTADVTYDLCMAIDGGDPNTVVAGGLTDSEYLLDGTSLMDDSTYQWKVKIYEDGSVDPVLTTAMLSFTTGPAVKKWSVAPWDTDDDLDVSVGKIYTHAVNCNTDEASSTVVKGILFEHDNDRTGTDWFISGFANGFAGGGVSNVTGEGAALLTGFYYGTPASITLTGLTPGVEYRTTLYTHSWGDPGTRFVNIATSDDGKTVAFDENALHDETGENGQLFTYTYIPDANELTLTFEPLVVGSSWHLWSFSNEVVSVYVDPTPAPGVDVSVNPELSWELFGDVTNPSYNLKVSATDPNLVNNLVVDQSGLTASSYASTLTEGNYYWGVEVVEDGGAVVYTSPAWALTVLPNTPPVVDAGEDIVTWLVDGTVMVSLTGVVTDDGQPDPPAAVSVLWETVPASGNVIIDSPTTETTAVTIDAAGLYTLSLTADDGDLTVSDTLQVQVYESACAHAKDQAGFVLLDGDINEDCEVNLLDLADMAGNWLLSNASQ